MTGKERCEFLRNVRMNIAEMNNISYTPHECDNEDWCRGYCPVCDEESSMLMRQLERLEASGCQIKIDVESIKALEEMAQKPYSDDIDDEDYYKQEVIPLVSGICSAPPSEDSLIQRRYWEGKGVSYQYCGQIIELCDGCYRADTVHVESGKPTRCACLSEHFFARAFEQGCCKLKKESADSESALDLYKAAKTNKK